MSDAPEPYVRRNANDLIRAADWNDIQIKTRQEIRTHTHTGGALGPKLTGDAIDPSAVLTVHDATIAGRLTVRARELLTEIDGILAEIRTLGTSAIARGPAGEIALADKELRLRGPTDGNHGLRWAGGQAFANVTLQGPALYGYDGGMLGTTTGQQRLALAWDSSGRVGIGLNVMTNQLDITNGVRTDTHGSQLALYVTANSQPAGGGVEFRHLNGTQGIGFGYSTIYATGSIANQDLTLQARGGGSLNVTSPLKLGNSDIYFIRTDHAHSGIGNTLGMAAIENTSSHNALMILGRSVSTNPLRRVVKLWDMLEVNGGSNDVNNPPFRVIHSNGQASVTLGAQHGPYVGDAIYGSPNLWLDAATTVYIKQGFQARGMDVAERFPTTEPLQAGDVVVYDPVLKAIRLCDQIADGRVVGIVSEAAAFILGTEAQQPAVALCGRVPCKVDANIAPIAPGDLLTTSPTRGHAQKADPARAVGAIIGKALEACESGRGEILVFVAMQ